MFIKSVISLINPHGPGPQKIQREKYTWMLHGVGSFRESIKKTGLVSWRVCNLFLFLFFYIFIAELFLFIPHYIWWWALELRNVFYYNRNSYREILLSFFLFAKNYEKIIITIILSVIHRLTSTKYHSGQCMKSGFIKKKVF